VEESERRYYDRRAPEYDDWYLGRGAHAGVHRPGWDDAVRELERVVASLPSGGTLDVACGTGFLTRRLRGEVTGLDASEDMLAIARRRAPAARFVRGDAFALPFADAAFDLVFSGHFYGHLRAGDRARFLAEARRVAPRLVLVDSAVRRDAPQEEMTERTLSDGSRHRIYKRRFDPDELADEVGGGDVLLAGQWFVAVSA
jgi:ubiquinone/menaquinone biosynthesis C-methylase UbiE